MRVRLIAAGTRLPQWINEGVAEYAKRFGHGLRFELIEIPTTRLTERMTRAIAPRDYVVTLEITGRAMTTPELAQWLGTRRFPLVAVAADLAPRAGPGDGHRAALPRAKPAARASLPSRLNPAILAVQ